MNVIRWGGIALIAGAIAFLGVFSYLAMAFNYPDVLDGSASTVLPSLLGTGTTGRVVWTIYAFLPLIWIPAGVAAFEAYGAESDRRGAMRLAMLCTIVAALAMTLGLMRWPTIHWHLAQAYGQAGPSEQAVIAATFDGLNAYLGNFIGEFLGEMAFSLFFLITSVCWLRVLPRRRWMGWLGVATGIAGLIGMFRNVTTIVAPVAALNNYLLPVFMIILGGALLHRARAATLAATVPSK